MPRRKFNYENEIMMDAIKKLHQDLSILYAISTREYERGLNEGYEQGKIEIKTMKRRPKNNVALRHQKYKEIK